jgi:cyclic pyranopterin phosphate synthase
MVDVGDKPVTSREAIARGDITMSAAALKVIRTGQVAKGDPLQTARLAGIMAAKQTASLIPLCHPLALTHVSVELTPTRHGYAIQARVRTSSQTGVEMEALTAVSVAALTIYDMIKAVDKTMVIGGICVVEKQGGRSGHYRRGNQMANPKPQIPNPKSQTRKPKAQVSNPKDQRANPKPETPSPKAQRAKTGDR